MSFWRKLLSWGTIFSVIKWLGSRLSHPNIVLFMGVSFRELDYYIITEYVPRGSLFDILYRHKVPLEWKILHNMALDTCRGMNYLHSQVPPIIHRDLKSPNLLVGNNWDIKICDFDILFLLNKFMYPFTVTTSKVFRRWENDDKAWNRTMGCSRSTSSFSMN